MCNKSLNNTPKYTIVPKNNHLLSRIIYNCADIYSSVGRVIDSVTRPTNYVSPNVYEMENTVKEPIRVS